MTELAACLANDITLLSLKEFTLLNDSLSATGARSDAAKCFAHDSRLRALLDSPERWQRAVDLQLRCRDENFQILYPGHVDYPSAFFELPQPPIFLSVQGKIPQTPMLSVVGSREPTRLAVNWFREQMPLFHAQREVPIVSGGARGVDQMAHLSAIEAGRPTVVFIPAGLQQLYPSDLKTWREIILQGGGALVSEFHPQAEMRKHYFLRRNRLIAALGHLVFIVEARRRSGSLLTARTAVEIHRNICVLPGNPLSIASQGSTDLLFDGAQPIRDVDDLLSIWDSSALSCRG